MCKKGVAKIADKRQICINLEYFLILRVVAAANALGAIGFVVICRIIDKSKTSITPE